MLGVMLVFVRTLAVEPLLEHSRKFGDTLNVLEPFIAVGNSNVLILLMPCVFMILVSDYPQITKNTLMAMPRIGRIKWYVGQIAFRFCAIGSFLTIMFLGGVVVSKGHFSTKWSDVVTKYGCQFPEEAESFASRLLPSNLYNQMSIINTLFHTIFLLGLYLLLLSEVMSLFQLLQLQPYGIIAVIIVMALGMVSCSLNLKCMWIFPLANSMIGIHFDKIFSSLRMPIWYSYAYFLALNFSLEFMNFCCVKKMHFLDMEGII